MRRCTTVFVFVAMLLPLMMGLRCRFQRNQIAILGLPFPDEYPQPHQVFQHIDGLADIVVRGDCQNELEQVEARWNGSAWTPIGSICQNGLYDGVLSSQPIGGKSTLEVRHASGAVIRQVPNVGVGYVFVTCVPGQSNCSGYTETQSAAGPFASVLSLVDFPTEGAFRQMTDPLHTPAYICGSVLPAVFDLLVSGTGAPVMAIAAASDATGLVQPPDWEVGGVLYNRAINNIAVATAGQMCITAFLAHQGERDARTLAWSGYAYAYSAYKGAVIVLADALQLELTCWAPVVLAQIGPVYSVPEEALAPIRDAQRDAALESPNIVAGPCTKDLPTIGDNTHFSDAAVPQLSTRWYESLGAVDPALGDIPIQTDLGCVP